MKRRFIGIFFAFVLVFSCALTTAHASASSSVTVSSLSLTSSEVKQGSSTVLNIGATVNDIGINEIDVHFTLMNSTTQLFWNDYYTNPNKFPDASGNIAYTFWAGASQAKGNYYLSQLTIKDANGGVRQFDWDSNKNLLVDSSDSSKTLTAPTLTVTGDDDTTAPVLTSIQLATTTIGVSSKAGINFGITETGSGLQSINVEMTDETVSTKPTVHATDYYPSPLKTGSYTVYVYSGTTPTAGVYSFSKITLSDKSGNSIEYSENSNKTDFERMAKGTLTIKNTVYDVTAPIVKSIKIVNDKVTKPGVITIQADIVEDGTGLKDFQVNLTDESKKNSLSWNDYYPDAASAKKTQTMTLKVGVDTEDAVGTYKISTISISDQAGNRTEYGFDQSQPSVDSISSANSVQVVEENLPVTVWTSLSNPQLVDKLDAMNDSSAAKLSDDTDIIPKAVFTSLAGTNKSIDVYKDGVEWVFNGSDIKSENIKDIDTTIQIKRVSGEQYGIANDAIQITFPNNGILPGKVKMRLKLDYLTYLYNLSGDLHLYYDNNNLLNQEDTDFVLASDNYLEFTLTHNSTFVISANEITADTVTSTNISSTSGTTDASDTYESPDTGYKGTSYLQVELLLITISAAGLALIVWKKRKV